ncbi:hypothetical protein [Streptomyces yangpuensis]|uniref:hypothetical protein n=1 Tax=Streptomyces yangpuensis TaxID=1648182 RepID=UPI00381615DD
MSEARRTDTDAVDAVDAVESHVRAYFRGHSVEAVDAGLGPERRDVVPDLRVLVVGPGPRGGGWAYVTAGCWAALQEDPTGWSSS